MAVALDQFVLIPENPLPEGGVCSVVRTLDGCGIRVATWLPQGPVSGTVCIFPGRSEFIEKYFEIVQDLRDRGLAVAALDWRGQGGSGRELFDPRKGHIDDFGFYLRDVDAFLRHLEAVNAPKPWFGIAHSMGGAIMLLSASRKERRLARMVMTSPMTGLYNVPLEGFAVKVASVLNVLGLGGRYLPRAGRSTPSMFSAFEGNVLTSDPVRYARAAAVLIKGGELGIGAPTVGWITAAFRLMAAMREPEFGLDMHIPTMIIAAGADTVVATSATEAVARQLRGVQVIVIPGARHEIMLERDVFRCQFWAAFDAFIPGENAKAAIPAASA